MGTVSLKNIHWIILYVIIMISYLLILMLDTEFKIWRKIMSALW